MDRIEGMLSKVPAVIDSAARTNSSLAIVAFVALVILAVILFQKSSQTFRAISFFFIFLISTFIIVVTLMDVRQFLNPGAPQSPKPGHVDIEQQVPISRNDNAIEPSRRTREASGATPIRIRRPGSSEGSGNNSSSSEQNVLEKASVTPPPLDRDQICIDNGEYRKEGPIKTVGKNKSRLVLECNEHGHLMQFTEIGGEDMDFWLVEPDGIRIRN